MDFSLTEEQELLVDSFGRFLDAEVRPVVESGGDEKISGEVMRDLYRRMLPFGMGNGLVDEEVGGYGMDEVTFGLLFEQLARVSPDVAIMVLIQTEVAMLVADAPDAFHASHLAPLFEGDLMGCIGISEPDVGSNIAEIKTRAVRDGEDWLISGEKCWISNGHYSDFIVLVARADVDGEAGLALFLVDRDMGYTTTDIGKMGLNRQSTAQVFFDEVRVPADRMIMPPGTALKRMLTLLQGSRPLVGLMATAIASRALDHSIDYARDRKQFGKPIAANQLIQARVAKMSVDIEASRLMLFKALHLIHRGQRCDLEVAQAKWLATESAVDVTRHALAIHGGNGITLEYPVQELYRAAPILTVTEGTAEMQQLIIGRILLDLPAF
jgi:alkylation response protein AidB-like acyl-CoA dehydrogenase